MFLHVIKLLVNIHFHIKYVRVRTGVGCWMRDEGEELPTLSFPNWDSSQCCKPELAKTRDLTLGLTAYVSVSVPDGGYLIRVLAKQKAFRIVPTNWTTPDRSSVRDPHLNTLDSQL